MSKSRAPFRMPKNSPDDSKTPSTEANGLTWNPLGLFTELVDSLENDLSLKSPTPVQSLVIPELLKQEKASLAFLAATGSGKTLAYLLPLMQQLKQQEMFENYERRPRRPRLLVLVPTRELALQITMVLKSLSHSIKLSSQALVGGQDKGNQRRALASRPVDVIVATPGRLLQHWKDETVFLGSLEAIVLDEMDTMLEQGFQKELREILYPLLYGKKPEKDSTKPPPQKENAPQIVLTSATMTQSIQKLLGDNPKTSKLSVAGKKLHRGGEEQYPKLFLPPMKIITAPGLHKAIPRLDQVFVDVGSTDKISLLVDVVSSQRHKATIIFCNTASSVQAVQYALAESRIETLSYHGELNSIARSENLQRFRRGASGGVSEDGSNEPNFLVCTDLAARGLDIAEVDHVVMFDFPLNAIDYLHRSGRTARAEGKGKVTAMVAKRDKVLAMAIEQAVMKGEALDGLSSRKSDYVPGAKFGVKAKRQPKGRRGVPSEKRGGGSRSRRS
jgi:superfamily II DNA/RNA helicase